MEVGLFINGERCPKDKAHCSPNGGNILITYDTSSLRVRSPETLSSSSDSDVIILGNGTGERGQPWSNVREGEFTRSLRSLRTPSPREIVTQWLQTSPAYKLTPTIVVERTVEDKEDSAGSDTASMFEIFDLGPNRKSKAPPAEIPSGSGIPLNPTSPETSRKQELCSYLQLMNMNSKSDKQRTKIRSSFHRRSNRVKNLIVQIEKRKLEERIYRGGVDVNSNTENAKLIQQIISLRQGAVLNGQQTAKPLPETPESSRAAILFTPSLLPIKVRQRRSAFDFAMRRFITDERITIKRLSSVTSDDDQSLNDQSDKSRNSTMIPETDFPTAMKRGNPKTANRRSSATRADYARSDITTKSKLKIVKDKYMNKQKVKRVISKMKRKVISNEKVYKNTAFRRSLTVFEKEIAKVSRLSRTNGRSKIHNLRIQRNRRIKHKENLPNKIGIENVLKTKQRRSPLHRNNGINNLAKIKQDNKEKNVVSPRKNNDESTAKENRLKLKLLFQEKQVEIVDLSVNRNSIELPLIKGFDLAVNNEFKSRETGESNPNCYLIDHTYVQQSKSKSKLENLRSSFCGFTSEEQDGSNQVANLTCLAIENVLEDGLTQNKTSVLEATTESTTDVKQLENEVVERETELEEVVSEGNEGTETSDLDDELIRYNMHDYFVPERLNSFSDISGESTSSRDESSTDSSTDENVTFKQKEIPVGVIAPKITKPDHDKVIIIETEPPLNFSNRITTRPITPPTYIPFISQNKTPSKTLHRNLQTNYQTRRKTPTIQQDDAIPKTPPSNSSGSNHCATLAPSDGRLLHAEYGAGQLVASQERLVTCWAQTPLGHILHSQELWIARGAVVRQQFADSVLKRMKNRLMIADNVVSYVEIWVKEHKSVFRERPVADVFAVLYSWKPNQSVEKKLIQLENIKGSADDVQCIILKRSRSVLVSWSIMQSAIKQATVLHLYQLSPDYQRVLTIKELKSIGTKIQSLHTIEDTDDLVIGCGENCVNIWNVEHGYIVATLDMLPDTLPEPKCLWTLCNQGFVFLLQECNDGLLRLIAINGMKIKITWKNLKIFNPPKEYFNLLGVCLENGILITCYENGILSWNIQTSELLTEEPLPMEDIAPFSPPSCFLSDSHLVQLERNGQIQVRHVLYHLLTSSDLSM